MKCIFNKNQLIVEIESTDKIHKLQDIINHFHFSRKLFHQLRMEKRITLNNKIVTADPELKCNDQLIFNLQIEEEMDYLPDAYNLKVLYEDDLVLIVDKPIHTIIYPSDKLGHHTLVNYIADYYQKTNQVHAIRPIHRLDEDTSGCMMICKQPFFQPYFDFMLAEKKMKRTYLAWVEGKISHSCTINKPIGSHRHVNNKYVISKNGQKAITHVKPFQTGSISLLSCQLETGRTHQIRVHLASIGHPLLGDMTYGKASEKINRCALHSASIEWIDPISQQIKHIDCPLPDDMELN